MNIGVLAELLGKPADELATAFNVENKEDALPEEEAIKHLKSHIEETIKSTRSKAKEEGKGWGVREYAKSVQTKLSELGATGADVDSMLEDLSTKVSAGNGGDEKTKRQLEILKTKNDELTAKLTGIEKEKETEKRNNVLKSKITPILVDFDGTDKAKELAVKTYLGQINAEIDGDDVFLMRADGKGYLQKTIDEDAKEYFSELFAAKKPDRQQPPKNPDQPKKPVQGKRDRNELLLALRKAVTSEERASIMEELEALKATA